MQGVRIIPKCLAFETREGNLLVLGCRMLWERWVSEKDRWEWIEIELGGTCEAVGNVESHRISSTTIKVCDVFQK